MEKFLERQELPKFVQEKKTGNPNCLISAEEIEILIKAFSQRKHQALIASQMNATKCLREKKYLPILPKLFQKVEEKGILPKLIL